MSFREVIIMIISQDLRKGYYNFQASDLKMQKKPLMYGLCVKLADKYR